MIEINLVAPAMLARAAVPAMRKAGRGHIINISSIGGRKGSRGRSAYRASKAALIIDQSDRESGGRART